MVILTDFAEAQLDALERYYDRLDRDLATIRLAEAVRSAIVIADSQAAPFLAAPRPYPDLKRLGWRWLKSGRYWIAFSSIPDGFAITAVFHERANIPGRLKDLRRTLP